MAESTDDENVDPRDVEEMVTAMLAQRVRAKAIPAVIRRPVEALGGRSMLEAAAGGALEDVRSLVETMFDIGRVQP